MSEPGHHHVHEMPAENGESEGFFSSLFESFTPRRQCMNYEADVIWLHAISDLFIALAYFSIPIALIYFVRRRKDLEFNWIFLMFAAFILACGTTHLFGVLALWNALYRLDGLVKAATAAVSVTTAVLLWPLIPRALAVPSPAELRKANQDLELEIREREATQEQLRRAKGDLERRVQERTAELARINDALAAEIRERESVQRQREGLFQREQQALAEARNANRVKDEFLATLSHELRTPLNAILGWSHILSKPHVDSETLRQGLRTIERSVRTQVRMIEDLLDMSRIVAGKIRLEAQQIQLGSVAAAAIDAVRPTADAKGVKLEGDLDSLISPITGDANRLQQVIWNLLSNAVKFTQRSGKIKIALKQANSHVEIIVNDTGQGIKSEFLPYLFVRFSQADSSTTRRFGGLGLGLSIVKHIVELHGGTVQAESPGPGKGATFTVRLPISAVALPPHVDATHPQLPVSGGVKFEFSLPSLAGVRILAIDDDQESLGIIRRVLLEQDAIVETAGTTREGLNAFDRFRPQIIVCDIGMPDADGYDLIREIRSKTNLDDRTTLAIALTALARPEDRLRAYAAGFQVHLSKPVDPAELVAVIASFAQTQARDSTS